MLEISMDATDPLVSALRRLCERAGGHDAVAKIIGSNGQSIYQIVSGRRLPSGNPKGVGPTLRQKLDEHFPGWRTATDPSSDLVSFVSISDPKLDKNTARKEAWNVAAWSELPDRGAVMVPMLAIKEDGTVTLDREGCEPMSARDLKRKKLSPPHAAWLAAPDNGMEPAIWEDETVVIDTSQTAVRDGKIYAVWYAGSAKLRRVFLTPTGGMMIKPDNPAFEIIELEKVDKDAVKIVGLYGFHITSAA